MARRLSMLVISTELAAGLALLVAGMTSHAEYPERHHRALAFFLAFSVLGVLLSVLTRQRGLVRRLHDRLFENSWETTLRYAIYLRFQILIGIALVAFPPVAVFQLRRLLDSLFYVSASELFYITWMGLLAAWSLMVSVQMTCIHGPSRFGGEPLRPRREYLDRLRPWKEELFALLTAPTIGFCLACSREWTGGLAAVLCGLAAAWLTLFITSWQREAIVPACVPPSTLLLDGSKWRRLLRRHEDPDEPPEGGILMEALLRILGPGYYDEERQRPLPGHMLAATLMLLVLCTYGLVGFAFRPAGGWNDYFPSLGYIMNVFMLAAWGLPAAAFFFDRWRVPVVLALGFGALSLYALSETDHYYVTRPVDPERVAAAPSLTPEQALEAWRQAREPEGDRMTVVVISGGGIAAAAWGVEVLTGLEEAIGAPFVQSLHALSAASGGSVAVMYYLDGFSAFQQRDAAELARIRAAASRSSMRAMAWGVAYPDMWRLLAPPLLKSTPYLDRGWALQEAWRGQLRHRDETLWGWRARIARGEMPVPLLDATAVESGRQFLLTPVDVRGPGAGVRFRSHHSFLNLYDGRDLEVVTAARLSATFPYVTPISRASPDSGGPEFHIADGAYLDNYGMTSMIEWLNSILPAYTSSGRRPKLLLVRISIREPNFVDDSMYEGKDGWTYTTLGPLLALMNASQANQIARNDQLFQLFQDRWTRGSNPPVQLEVANFALSTEAPLSWQLTESACEQIRQRWREERAGGEQFARVVQFFSDSPAQGQLRFAESEEPPRRK